MNIVIMENSRKDSLELGKKEISCTVFSQCLSLTYLHDILMQKHLSKVFNVLSVYECYKQTAFDDLTHS